MLNNMYHKYSLIRRVLGKGQKKLRRHQKKLRLKKRVINDEESESNSVFGDDRDSVYAGFDIEDVGSVSDGSADGSVSGSGDDSGNGSGDGSGDGSVSGSGGGSGDGSGDGLVALATVSNGSGVGSGDGSGGGSGDGLVALATVSNGSVSGGSVWPDYLCCSLNPGQPMRRPTLAADTRLYERETALQYIRTCHIQGNKARGCFDKNFILTEQTLIPCLTLEIAIREWYHNHPDAEPIVEPAPAPTLRELADRAGLSDHRFDVAQALNLGIELDELYELRGRGQPDVPFIDLVGSRYHDSDSDDDDLPVVVPVSLPSHAPSHNPLPEPVTESEAERTARLAEEAALRAEEGARIARSAFLDAERHIVATQVDVERTRANFIRLRDSCRYDYPTALRNLSIAHVASRDADHALHEAAIAHDMAHAHVQLEALASGDDEYDSRSSPTYLALKYAEAAFHDAATSVKLAEDDVAQARRVIDAMEEDIRAEDARRDAEYSSNGAAIARDAAIERAYHARMEADRAREAAAAGVAGEGALDDITRMRLAREAHYSARPSAGAAAADGGAPEEDPYAHLD
jgi:hypothetical protein